MEKFFILRFTMRKVCGLLCFLICVASLGCQSLGSSKGLKGLDTTRAQRKVLQQVEHDPFPTPADVGMKAAE